MKSKIFIEVGKGLSLDAYLPIATRMMSLITEAAEGVDEIDTTFSIDDLFSLLNKASERMSGEFEMHRTPSCYYQMVYKPNIFNAAEFDEGYNGFVETHDVGQNRLWVSEKVLVAFIDRKLYGVATMLYFYLGYLMTCDETLAVSRRFSFEKILESCDAFPEECRVKHPTTIMRALADLEDAELMKWDAKARTFELLHITVYDPNQRV